MNLQVIYQPKGRAKEYNPWALNLYKGCGHGCLYCYAPKALQISREEFDNPLPRPRIIDRLLKDCLAIQGEDQFTQYKILLCFSCDPYQPINDEFQLAKQAIEILHFYGHKVIILTKGGLRAMADMPLLGQGDEFAVTLTCLDPSHRQRWEPSAAPTDERILTLREAKQRGLYTWVSLEPVLYTKESLEIIELTHSFVDEFKLGILNYDPRAQNVNWKAYAKEAIALLEKYNKKYLLKDDLKAKL